MQHEEVAQFHHLTRKEGVTTGVKPELKHPVANGKHIALSSAAGPALHSMRCHSHEAAVQEVGQVSVG